jgi:type VI secretion system protein
MLKQRLFERLLAGNVSMNTSVSVMTLTESIKNHVTQLLSTRQGDAKIRPDLGLPDLNISHMTPHDAILHIKREVERVISQYETRIINTKVNYLGNINSPIHLYFEINGDILLNNQLTPISFNTYAQKANTKPYSYEIQGLA